MPLTIKPPRQASAVSDSDHVSAADRAHSRSTSPVQPCASPLTPTAARHSALFSRHATTGSAASTMQPPADRVAKSEFIDKPAPRPFSGDDATDAIALRAAISSLQFQRQKAERDIKTLQKIRDDALARPDDFQQHIIRVATQQAQPPKSFDFTFKDDDNHDSDEDEKETANKAKTDSSSFPPIPRQQDVVRCPPVNWEKYHIVGEPLDRMHNAQRQAGIPSTLAAPYDPAVDRLDARPKASGGDRRKDSVSVSAQSKK